MFNGQMVERRRAVRNRVIKAAQVASGGASFGCVAFDLSASGVRLHCQAVAEMPEQAILRLPDGTSRPAQRRWQLGTESGFEFLAGTHGWLRGVP